MMLGEAHERATHSVDDRVFANGAWYVVREDSAGKFFEVFAPDVELRRESYLLGDETEKTGDETEKTTRKTAREGCLARRRASPDARTYRQFMQERSLELETQFPSLTKKTRLSMRLTEWRYLKASSRSSSRRRRKDEDEDEDEDDAGLS